MVDELAHFIIEPVRGDARQTSFIGGVKLQERFQRQTIQLGVNDEALKPKIIDIRPVAHTMGRRRRESPISRLSF